MLSPLSNPIAPVGVKKFKPQVCNQAQQAQAIAELAQQLGISLSQNDVTQLVQAIAAGGQSAMELATFIADSLAGANYTPTPQLVTDLINTLNQGGNQDLWFSLLVKARLSTITLRR